MALCKSSSWFPAAIPASFPIRPASRHVIRRSSSSTGVYEALLDWADASEVKPLSVSVQQHPEYGRCLVASEDIANGAVLLSVPLEQVFQSQTFDDLEMHWAADMALRLLQARHASRNQHDSASSNSSSASFWAPWVDCLPEGVVTPVEFTTQEVEQLVIPSTVQAIMNARESLEGCFEVLQLQLKSIDCTWQDFLWAVQVLHSRCFYESSAARHMAVPGVDMCNHSYTPNATVRLVHSPAACQGLDALEEVAPVAAAAACPSYFQLVADTSVRRLPQAATDSSDALRLLMRPSGIQAGEQVTISYGPWPTEPLLLLFGFVPQHNPHDSLVVFTDLSHMTNCCLELFKSRCGVQGSNQAGSAAAAAAAAAVITQPAFAELLHQHVQDAQEAEEAKLQSAGQQEVGGPPGFRDLTVFASSSSDVRLQPGLQLVQQAVAAAIQGVVSQEHQQQQQEQQEACCTEFLTALVRAVVPHRLQQLAHELDAAAAAASTSGGPSHEEVVETVEEGISYQSSAQHRSLITAYCASKASLAKQLLARL